MILQLFPLAGRSKYDPEDLRGQSAMARGRSRAPTRGAHAEASAVPHAQPAETPLTRSLNAQPLHSREADL